MLGRVRTALTARSTVIALLALLAAAMTVAAIVPQLGLEAEGGLAKPGPPSRWTGLVGALGLDRVFSTRWFAALALLFIVSLALSTLEQLRLARARMFHLPREAPAGVSTPLSPEELDAVLRSEGYRRVARAHGGSRHVRHWQGYWGSFLLHAGMTIVVLFSVMYVLTEHRAKLRLVSGRPVVVEPGTYPLKRGLLARDIPIPARVSLYRFEPTFGVNDQLVDLASQVVFTDAKGRSRDVHVAVNDHQDYDGITVYQLVEYGHAFFLELDDGSGRVDEHVLEMAFPPTRGAPSYLNRPLADGRLLKAKYYASADRTALVSDTPQLVVRLYEGERLVEEATLIAGQSAPLGPLRVRLARVGWWTELLLEGSLGTFGIFAGFAVLLAGGVLTFFAAPRDVLVYATPAGQVVQWRTTRFPEMYREERERVMARCTGGRIA